VNLVFASVVGVLFGTGVLLLLKADLFRVVVGLMLISNAASLTLMSSGLTRGQAAILPAAEPDKPVADPLVQALTLTALVIGFAVTALLLALSYRVYRARRSVDLDELSLQEAEEATESEAREAAHDEESEPEEAERQERMHDEAMPTTSSSAGMRRGATRPMSEEDR
jgi:multicomponent Na+:H+ antiporter subunit C